MFIYLYTTLLPQFSKINQKHMVKRILFMATQKISAKWEAERHGLPGRALFTQEFKAMPPNLQSIVNVAC